MSYAPSRVVRVMRPPYPIRYYVPVAALLMAPILISAAEAAVATTSGWAVIPGREVENGSKLFRKYSIIPNSSQGIPNTITYHCSSNPNESKRNSYIAITLPNAFPIKSFGRNTHVDQLGVKVKVDSDDPFYIMAEYHNGEIFIDRNKYTEVEFTKMIAADDVDLLFGSKDDEIAFHMTEKVDQAIAGVGSDGSGVSLSMHLTQLSRHDMEQECTKYSNQQR